MSTRSTSVPERKGFWRSWSAPANLGNDRDVPRGVLDENAPTPTAAAATTTATSTTLATAAEQKKEEGGIMGSLKKVFTIGLGRRRPTA